VFPASVLGLAIDASRVSPAKNAASEIAGLLLSAAHEDGLSMSSYAF
jgi:hypothetical protein